MIWVLTLAIGLSIVLYHALWKEIDRVRKLERTLELTVLQRDEALRQLRLAERAAQVHRDMTEATKESCNQRMEINDALLRTVCEIRDGAQEDAKKKGWENVQLTYRNHSLRNHINRRRKDRVTILADLRKVTEELARVKGARDTLELKNENTAFTAADAFRDIHTMIRCAAAKLPPGEQEGSVCCRDGCFGRVDWTSPKNCSCHLGMAPCPSCTSVYLRCDTCFWASDTDCCGGIPSYD